MDMDWLWDTESGPGNDGTPATVRLTVRGEGAREAVREWFEELPSDALGSRGMGGWMVQESSDPAKASPDEAQVDITSGGEDVADGIKAGTADAYEALDALGLELTWENLPRVSEQ